MAGPWVVLPAWKEVQPAQASPVASPASASRMPGSPPRPMQRRLSRRRLGGGCSPWLAPLLLVLRGPCAAGQFGEQGLAAEYFAMPASTCNPKNGSTNALDGMTSNITKKVAGLAFENVEAFKLERCAFEVGPSGDRRQVCRGANELRASFAARFTGSLWIAEAGVYSFQLEADDGARVIIGNDDCPGTTCGDREAVLNIKLGNLRKTYAKDTTFATECGECASGILGKCHQTTIGCEPFSMWILEGDNGLNGTCKSGPSIYTGYRYFEIGLHPIKVEYFQRGGPAYLLLKYRGGDTNDQLVPIPSRRFLYPVYQGLTMETFWTPSDVAFLPPTAGLGTVYGDAQLLKTEISLLDNDEMEESWTAGMPGKLVKILKLRGGGALYVRWTGVVIVEFGGTYEFSLESDDGSRLMLAGRGMDGQVVVVDNGGITANRRLRRGSTTMLPGPTPIRIEYLYSPSAPGAWGDPGIAQPPHMKVTWKGNDTAMKEMPLSFNRAQSLMLYDSSCASTNWEWGQGLSLPRDCSGTCYDGGSDTIGDYVCDRGTTTPLNFFCPTFNFDMMDCLPREVSLFTTPRPANPCLESCPAGDFFRKDCARCKVRKGDMCMETQEPTCVAKPGDPPGQCNFAKCCVAKITNLDYWNEDCLAFGTYDDCNTKLDTILKDIRSSPRSLPSRTVSPKLRELTAEIMIECEGGSCATITVERKRDPFTNRLTDLRVCPVDESNNAGVECFVGPWSAADNTPLDNCQDDKFKYNFCTNRKTKDGRPFRKCCAFIYLNSRAQPQCAYTGIEEGTCAGYLEQLKISVQSSVYTSINNELVIRECEEDQCNDPLGKEGSCPDVVIKRPPQVLHLLTNDIDKEAALLGGGAVVQEPIPWALILIPICGVGFMACVGYTIYKCIKEPEHSLWHSDKAKIVALDTFVEPTQDLSKGSNDVVEGIAFGVVKPRPYALRHILREESGVVVPKALRLEPELYVPEAAEAAYIAALEREAAIKGLDPRELRMLAESVGAGSPAFSKGSKLPVEFCQKVLKPYVESLQTMSMTQARSRMRTKDLELMFEDEADIVAPQALEDTTWESPSRGRSRPGTNGALALTGELTQLALPGEVPEPRTAKRSSALNEAELARTFVVPPPPADNREELRHAAAALADSQRSAMPISPKGGTTIIDALQMSVTVGTIVAPAQGSLASLNSRSAASARFLRKGQSGPPRVAT